MGRIRLRSLLAIVPIHLLACYGTGFFVQQVFPVGMSTVMLESPSYDTEGAPWILYLSKQVLLTTVFSVAILVLPVLFELNRVPRWTMVLFLHPLYNFAVDKSGIGDLFSPSFLLITILNNQPTPPLWRFLGSLIGGLTAGIVMNNYFPDARAPMKTE